MAEKLHFALVSPERELFNGEVDHVVVPGSEGEFGVLPNHAPVMSVIKPGALKVIADGAERRIFVNGGFADVTPEGLTVLAEEAVDLADIDAAQIEQQLKDAGEDLRDANSDAKREAAQRAVARLESIRAALTR
ncbi:MAG TPA: F0F1 ATP synthase subunit epsilon [Vitreimonas sp.]|uniref:F0F1 ATP synthase subunit epsilon n=1 Tax=Vitreimonas sp. TaxID=3069702 RepID=UPI002D37DB83|nr:F0F1 ATP synthase subunit epsilon [Vitreimonas sp.]HYD89705.1 F0F1 ATP synthase subunit epsilon [Vitreimonas sp.]